MMFYMHAQRSEHAQYALLFYVHAYWLEFLSGYADDHAMIHCFSPDNKNIKENIENDIGKIKTWMEENQLRNE